MFYKVLFYCKVLLTCNIPSLWDELLRAGPPGLRDELLSCPSSFSISAVSGHSSVRPSVCILPVPLLSLPSLFPSDFLREITVSCPCSLKSLLLCFFHKEERVCLWQGEESLCQWQQCAQCYCCGDGLPFSPVWGCLASLSSCLDP